MPLPRVPRTRPRPKLRAIPRQKTEASAYAEMQQLAVEKQRLQQELEYLQERQSQIQTRMAEINQAVDQLNQNAGLYRQDPLPNADPAAISPQHAGSNSVFSPMIIDY